MYINIYYDWMHDGVERVAGERDKRAHFEFKGYAAGMEQGFIFINSLQNLKVSFFKVPYLYQKEEQRIFFLSGLYA